MRIHVAKKFNQFILNPDLANKFLLTSTNTIPNVQKKYLYFFYLFRQKNPYSFIAIKAMLMLNSIFSKNSQTNTKIIILRFSQNQHHSIIFMKLFFNEFIDIIPLYYIKPASIRKIMTSFINQRPHFIFPGFINHLRFPSWKQNIKISFQGSHENNYWLFFFKSMFID